MIRNIIAQKDSRIDFRDALDRGKIVIVNLSNGKLGERTSAFLGSLFVSQFQLEAMSRADVPEMGRRGTGFQPANVLQGFQTGWNPAPCGRRATTAELV